MSKSYWKIVLDGFDDEGRPMLRAICLLDYVEHYYQGTIFVTDEKFTSAADASEYINEIQIVYGLELMKQALGRK